jgi:Fur family peroxide stress response transcriptional regulator
MLIKADVTGRYDHPTAAMIYESVRTENPMISLGTVYRNLDKLVAEGEIIRISVPNRADRFDATTKEHYHLVCKGCGKAVDIESTKIMRALDKVFSGDARFVVDDVQLVAMGLCENCVNKGGICQN